MNKVLPDPLQFFWPRKVHFQYLQHWLAWIGVTVSKRGAAFQQKLFNLLKNKKKALFCGTVNEVDLKHAVYSILNRL